MDTIYRRSDVEAASGFTERQLRDMEEDGHFPKRFIIKPGGRAVGWLRSEVQAWIKSRAASRTTERGEA